MTWYMWLDRLGWNGLMWLETLYLLILLSQQWHNLKWLLSFSVSQTISRDALLCSQSFQICREMWLILTHFDMAIKKVVRVSRKNFFFIKKIVRETLFLSVVRTGQCRPHALGTVYKFFWFTILWFHSAT